jgi:hypothetical protein
MGREVALDRLVRLPFTDAEIRARLPSENCLYHPTVMLRRQPILELGGYRAEFKNAEDYDLWLRACRSHQLANIPRPLLRYRLSTGGMTIGRKWEQLRYVFLAQESHRDEAASWDVLEKCVAARLAGMDRQGYFDHVVEDVCRRLAQLGFEDEALTLVGRMCGELSAKAAGKLEQEIRGLASSGACR